ncbi:MAG: phosphoribosylamine--glycine ligase [Nevskiales bacterium]
MSKKILIVGGGGREHALAWKAAQSPQVSEVLVAPGNAGTAREPGLRNIDIAADDITGLAALAEAEGVDLTIVGPEAPLAAGIVNVFTDLGLRCFGPSQKAAELEASKAFSKDFLARHNIPTAAYEVFTEVEPAIAYIKAQGAPIVVKADGLAAGKGVILAQSEDEAIAAVQDMLSGNAFGEAGSRVVIEEFLSGEEASFICLVDGENALPLATSQDHKAAHDGDTGPNTGGMGAYSPAPVVTSKLHNRIVEEVIKPTVAGMAADGRPFTGFLYAGIMLTADGSPKVLEFNVRMGDPETQPIMLRLQSDLIEIIEAALDGQLDKAKAEWDKRAALGVVLAAGGYPGSYGKGDTISGLDDELAGSKVFHAGTELSGESVVTNGGRVLCVCALGESVSQAQALAYQQVDRIQWNGMQCRRDIGYRAIARET